MIEVATKVLTTHALQAWGASWKLEADPANPLGETKCRLQLP
ncbi:MAG: hypothetical protein ACNA7E_05855 [Wenzhouxiangellaceae bacterium]